MSRDRVRRSIEAELTWTGEAFEPGVRVELGDDGRIARVASATSDEPSAPPTKLPGHALLPGFVNAHSHAFQRGLRGRGERFPDGAGSFWSWREAMYGLVAEMDAERMHALSLQAFREMLSAGITTVGEFHYLHHARAGADDWALDRAVLRAAREAGIRLRLLSVYYATGGIGQPLSPAQERFRSPTPAAYWEAFDALAEELDPVTQSLGCVVHSIRAAGLDDLGSVHAEARRRGLVFHMHVEEQRREIADCVAAYGRRPMELLCDELAIEDGFTAVHGTHTAPADAERFLDAGGNLCVCPLTEANLGDGVLAAAAALEKTASIALGTDSNARVSMIEEMRWLEYAQRLARERRGAFLDGEGRVAHRLLAAATTGGAQSLGLAAGSLEPGCLGDFVTLDLEAPALEGAEPENLLDAFVFGADERAVADVCVGGRFLAGGPAESEG